MDEQGKESEQDIFPLTIRPNQSLLVEELKSKFENIDRRFDSLFEHMNINGNVNPPPKTVASNSDSQVICKQISDVLEQWTGRRTQNYFELKHIFQLLNAFCEERYRGNGLNLVLQRAREVLAASKTSWNFVRKATVSGDQKFPFFPPDHFGEAIDLGCEVQSLGKKRINHQTTSNGLQVSNFPSLNDEIALDKFKIFKSFLLSKSLVEVNLCNRPSSTQGEFTSDQLTQSDDCQRFQFDEEMDMLMQDLDP